MNTPTLTLPVRNERSPYVSTPQKHERVRIVPNEVAGKAETVKRYSRIPVKAPGKDLKKHYATTLQIASILALGTLILLLRMPMQAESSFEPTYVEQEIVQMEEIIQTEQAFKAPPPPRPAVPIEVPNDEVLEDEEFELDVALDLDEAIVNLEMPDLPVAEEEEVEEDSEIFMVVEEMPQMIGGIKKLYEFIEYPTIAKEAGLQGTVVVNIVINKDGTPGDVTVMKSVHAILDEAAVNAIQKVRFTPGKQRGKPVRVRMSIPVRFKLL